jgi:hypothetical protein
MYEINDYLLLSLEHIYSEAVLFNYNNTLTIYNHIGCDVKTEKKLSNNAYYKY